MPDGVGAGSPTLTYGLGSGRLRQHGRHVRLSFGEAANAPVKSLAHAPVIWRGA